jgi:hypothetical protein
MVRRKINRRSSATPRKERRYIGSRSEPESDTSRNLRTREGAKRASRIPRGKAVKEMGNG